VKIQTRQIDAFVQSPDKAARVILVYGPDAGLMKERIATLGKTVLEDLNDPFNACTLSGAQIADDPARLTDEASAMSMMGGDRLIRIEDAGDKITPYIKDYLINPNQNALVLLEGGDLGARSSLRKLCEAEKNAAAVPCYVEDERGMANFIRQTMQNENYRIEPDAVQWLAASITGDRQRARSEVEKLMLYKGREEGDLITLADVHQACGSAGSQSIDDLVFSVGGRNPPKALHVYQQLLNEGVNFIVVLRSLQNHFRRLHYTRSLMADGDNLEMAMKALRPPVFFKVADAFRAQAQSWSLPALNKVLERLNDLEAECKKTGAPSETLCAQTVLGISSMRRA